MPRVTTHTANKDHPRFGIKKGDKYFAWRVRTAAAGGVDYKSMTYPRPSQLNFGFTGRLGDITQDMGNAETHEDLAGFAEALRELGEECQESFDNMPEGLQQGDTGQLLEERANGLSEWADAVEEAATEWETALEELNALKKAWEDYDSEYAEWEGLDEDEQDDTPEPDEPDDSRPDEDAEGELQSQYVSQASDADPGL